MANVSYYSSALLFLLQHQHCGRIGMREIVLGAYGGLVCMQTFP